MIVRDEAAHLPDCLASIRDVVDEIVVVDTGSGDATREIARTAGATVVDHVWNDSFADARNVGLDLASGDWILYIDADERLRAPTSRAAMGLVLRQAEQDGVGALRVNLTLVAGQTHGYEWRLWRHHPTIRFEGLIHESIAPSIHRRLDVVGQRHADVDEVRLLHLGYEGDQIRKHHRNLPMLFAEAERNPTRPYLWNHLGRVLEGLGRVEEARMMWNRAIEVVRATDPDRRSLVDSMSHADIVIRAAEAGRDESELIAEGLALFPGNWVIRWAAAVTALMHGDYGAAAEGAEAIIAAQPDQIHRGGLTYPTQLFADWPQHLLGMCRFEQGRYEEAAEAFDRASALAPEVPAYAVKAAAARGVSERSTSLR